MAGYGLVAIVSAQASSVIIIRWLSYRAFFSHEMKQKLQIAVPRPKKEVLKSLVPNALKIGLTSLGGFLVQRSAIVIGSLYLTLDEIASYGISIQLISVIAGLAGIYITTYQPKIAQLRVAQNNSLIKDLYLRGQIVLLFTYLVGGMGLFFFGEWTLNLVRSQTHLIAQSMLFLSIVVSFLECNHSIAGTILLSKNEVPFFKAALLSGGATVLLLILFFQYLNIGLWAMIAAPGLAQIAYQNWKWPIVVINELKINRRDVSNAIIRIKNSKSK
jgi:hypothetical protein